MKRNNCFQLLRLAKKHLAVPGCACLRMLHQPRGQVLLLVFAETDAGVNVLDGLLERPLRGRDFVLRKKLKYIAELVC